MKHLTLLLLALYTLTSCTVHLNLGKVRQPLIVPVQHESKERYQAVKPWDFDTPKAREQVPGGFVADGASVPRAAWPFMPPDGLHRAAALAHDYLYACQGITPHARYTRHECDVVFYNLMREAGIGSWRAGVAYRAVRMGGGGPWARSSGQPLVLPVLPDSYGAPPTSKAGPFRHLYENPATTPNGAPALRLPAVLLTPY